MSRLLSFAAGLTCLFVAGSTGYMSLRPAGPAAAPPSGLVIEDPVRDFGALGQMETVRAEFRLVNHFPAAVEIKDVLAGCACADASVNPRRLEPGQAATLTVAWRTGAKRGRAAESIEVLAVVYGERPLPCPVRATLAADIQPDILCDPAEVRFERGKADRVTLYFRPGHKSDARILSAYPTVAGLRTTIDQAAGAVAVAFDPAKIVDDGIGVSVMVHTNSPKEPWVTVPVTFTGEGRK